MNRSCIMKKIVAGLQTLMMSEFTAPLSDVIHKKTYFCEYIKRIVNQGEAKTNCRYLQLSQLIDRTNNIFALLKSKGHALYLRNGKQRVGECLSFASAFVVRGLCFSL